MTAQLSELFEYQGTVYAILGIQGGSLIPIEDLIVKLRMDGQSTALYRGYQGTYAVDESRHLILKYASVPFARKKKVNQLVPMTGYILFSNVHDPWMLALGHYGHQTLDTVVIFEAEIIEGHVAAINDCKADVVKKLQTLPPERVSPFDTDGDREQVLHRFWDWTTLFLPRRYDVLMLYVNYFHFPTLKGI